MRVGILTFHACYNYGGVVQCLALQEALLRLGLDVEVIDYNPVWKARWIQRWAGLVSRRLAESLLSRLGSQRFGAAHYKKFQTFRKEHLRLSEPCLSIRQLRQRVHNYDALIVGSDQVWNGEWNWPVYFLDFAQDYKGLRISYAACFGHDNQRADFLRRVPGWLARFDAISVRNRLSQEMVKRYGGREAEIVADPTLLVDLRPYARAPQLPCPSFILVYSLKTAAAEATASVVRRVKEQLKLPVVSVIPGSLPSAPSPGSDHVVDDAGPAEWVWLLTNASFICTDSFHGTMFALKYRKPFIIFDRRSDGSKRLYDFADRFGVTGRLVGEPEQLDKDAFWNQRLDFDAIHARLDTHIQQSYGFLKSALGLSK